MLLLALLATAALPAPALAASLYSGSAPRPGPDILYETPPTPPQLENTGIWKAQPLLVSGASAYSDGEFLYQDFLYDDHGARGPYDPTDPRGSADTFSKPDGAYTYPTDPAYANNAADLVELRVKPLADSTALRVTLNTLKDPSLVALSIAIGGTPGVSQPFPDGANVSAPADLFLTVHPAGGDMTADLVHAGTGAPVSGPAPTVSVDSVRRQIEVRVPHADWDPSGQVVRLAAGVGLWDKAANRYLLPQGSADASHPGGASSADPPAFFNVAFRNDEPFPAVTDPAGTSQAPAWWRDKAQADAIASGDITTLHADVDFARLAAGTDDDSGVPKTGPIDRILPSRFETAQGVDFSHQCLTQAETCKGEYQGRLQPYAVYVPKKAAPSRGYGLTLLLHSLGTNYNQYLGSRNQSQFGERGQGSIVVSTESRGPDGSYTSYAGVDVFEVWADVARHYPLDPDWTVTAGYSMGAIGTFKLAEQFPDLFARAQPTVGFSSDNGLLPSLRNVPVLMWNVTTDELVGPELYVPTAAQLDSLGYRYELDVFSPADHLTLAINDQYAPAAAFLGTGTVDRNPAHVTYVVDPSLDYPPLHFVADHAYWLSGLKSRSTAQGTIDAFSHGFGVGDPPASGTQAGADTLTGGTLPAIAYSRQYRTWGGAPRISRADRLDLKARNVSSATLHVERARVDCAARVGVDTDGPIAVHLEGCGRTLSIRCLSPRARVGRRGIGRLRLRRTRRALRRGLGAPARQTRRADRYCVRGGGTGRVAFSRRGRAQLVASTARGHRVRGVGRGASIRRLRRAYPGTLRVGRGLMRGGRSSHAFFGVRRGKVTYVAVATRSAMRSRRTLRRYLRLAGL